MIVFLKRQILTKYDEICYNNYGRCKVTYRGKKGTMQYMDISKFIEIKKRIHVLLSQIEDVCRKLDIPEEIENIQKIIADLEKVSFQIVVVGEFSRGKSMFINALIGKRILPSSTKPTTTIINRIVYGDAFRIKLFFREPQGSNRLISEDEFRKIVAPEEPIEGDEESQREYREKVEYVSNIEYARIEYPFLMCKDGIEIVDTPGTNDIDYRREEITYKFIPNSDAAIFLLSANQPLAESEKLFLRDRILAQDIQKIFFVINFKDRLNSFEDEQKVIQHVRKGLRDLIDEPKVFLVSAKEALNYRRMLNGEANVKVKMKDFESTGFPELERALSDFLVYERSKVKLSKPVQRGIKKCEELIKHKVDVERAALDQKMTDLEAKIKKLRPEIQKFKKFSSDLISKFVSSMEVSYSFVEEQLKIKLEGVARAAVKCIDEYSGELTYQAVARAVENSVAPLQTELQESISKMQKEVIQSELERINRVLGYNWDKLGDYIIERLKSEVSKVQFEIALPDLTDKQGLLVIEENNRTFIDYDASFKKKYASSYFIYIIAEIIAKIAGFVEIFINNIMGYGNKRQEILDMLRIKVDQRYRGAIPGVLKTYRKQWNDTVKSLTKSLEKEIDSRIKSTEQQFNNLLRQNKDEEKSYNFLFEQEQKLLAIKRELSFIFDQLNGGEDINVESIHYQDGFKIAAGQVTESSYT